MSGRTTVFDENWLDADARAVVRGLAKNHEMWHRKPLTGVLEQKFTFAPQVFRAGRAVEILYSSDKWEKDGDVYDYIHSFSSGPSLYRAKPKVGQPRDTRKLLHVEDLNDAIPMVQLARVKEVVVDDGHERWPIKFVNEPMLVSLFDLKTLVILHRDPIFIVGGKMSVRAPGITR